MDCHEYFDMYITIALLCGLLEYFKLNLNHQLVEDEVDEVEAVTSYLPL